MKERHLDGTVLIKGGGGGGSGVFEPLARPDLLITDAERALLIVPRRKDRDAFLLGTLHVFIGIKDILHLKHFVTFTRPLFALDRNCQ